MLATSAFLLSALLVASGGAPASAASFSAILRANTLNPHDTLQLGTRPPQSGLDLVTSRGQTRQTASSQTRWQQQAELTASDGVAGDHLGGPVALCKGMALVGAWDKNHAAGAAYIFIQHAGHWTQQSELTAGDSRPGAWFGVSVALSGSIALVGAPMAGHTGAAYVFMRSGGSWTEQAILTASDGADSDWFGRSVALSGDTAVVAAWNKQNHTGAAYIFVRSGSRWSQQSKLTASDGRAGDYFGTSVALSAGTALVGAAGANNTIGAAYVFVRNGTRWLQQSRLAEREGAVGDDFGTSVALSGATALVGAGGANRNKGEVYAFTRDGSRWTQQAQLAAGDGVPGDWFGRTVSLSRNTALVGAWYANNHTGAAYSFLRTGSHWNQEAKLVAADSVTDDYFGSSVAVSDGIGLVGAGFKHRAAGAAYVFQHVPASNIRTTTEPGSS